MEAGKGARHDSPKFVAALNIWYPLVIARQPRPRAAIYEFDPEALKAFLILNSYETSAVMRSHRPQAGTAKQQILEKRELHLKEWGLRSWNQIIRYASRFPALWLTIDIR